MVDTLKLPLEEVKDSQYKLLDTLQSVTPTQVALPNNEELMDPAKAVWQISGTILATCKWTDKKYCYQRTQDFCFAILQLIPMC